VPVTTTDRSDERHAEAAGSVESHIESPTPSLLVLHPGAPQRHSQIRRPGLTLGKRPRASTYGVSVSASSPSTGHVSTALLSRLLSDLFVPALPAAGPGNALLVRSDVDRRSHRPAITASLRWRVRTNVATAEFTQAERLRLRLRPAPRPTVCSSTSPACASDGYWRCGAR
jgi:hypothetical protein